MAETINSGIYGQMQTRIPEIIQAQAPDLQAIQLNAQRAQANDQSLKQNQFDLAQQQKAAKEDQDFADTLQRHTQVGENGELILDRKGAIKSLMQSGNIAGAQKAAKMFDEQDARTQALADKKRAGDQAAHKAKQEAAFGISRALAGLPEEQRASAYTSMVRQGKASGQLPADIPEEYTPEIATNMTALYNQQLTPDKIEDRANKRDLKKPAQWQIGPDGTPFRTADDGSIEYGTRTLAKPDKPEKPQVLIDRKGGTKTTTVDGVTTTEDLPLTPNQRQTIQGEVQAASAAADTTTKLRQRLEDFINKGTYKQGAGPVNAQVGKLPLPTDARQAQKEATQMINEAFVSSLASMRAAGLSPSQLANSEAERRGMIDSLANLDWASGDEHVGKQLRILLDKVKEFEETAKAAIAAKRERLDGSPTDAPVAPTKTDYPVITSQAEFNKLPPGAVFQDANGNLKRKKR